MLKAGEMGKRKVTANPQIVMNRRMCQSISKLTDFVACSWHAVVIIYQKWSEEKQPVNQAQDHGHSRLTECIGSETGLVRSDRRTAVAQIAEKGNAAYDGKAPEHTHVCMELQSYKPIRVPMLTPVQPLWSQEQ